MATGVLFPPPLLRNDCSEFQYSCLSPPSQKKVREQKKGSNWGLDDQARRSGDYSWTQDRRGRDSPPRAASHHPAQLPVIAQTTDFLGKNYDFLGIFRKLQEFLGNLAINQPPRAASLHPLKQPSSHKPPTFWEKL